MRCELLNYNIYEGLLIYLLVGVVLKLLQKIYIFQLSTTTALHSERTLKIH